MSDEAGGRTRQGTPVLPRPEWLRVRFSDQGNYQDLKGTIRGLGLHTVCEEAQCPNVGDCWGHRVATFMILGRICTRACRFCAITTGVPTEVDAEEPRRVAEAVRHMGLRHAVVTSVARDDLLDGGAAAFAATIRAVRLLNPETTVEVLVPDFQGSSEALRVVLASQPDVLNHNVETVERLQHRVRAKAFYARSLEVLRRAKEFSPDRLTKSGLMVGVGETREEILRTMRDLRGVGCDVLTIGQYLRPSPTHLPIERYYTPDEFRSLRDQARQLGFRHIQSGPLVRSSYHAHEGVAPT